MENRQIIQEKKKKKKQQSPPPLKVVYISNPMKLNTSASNFRSLVQELTGQHSVWPVDPSKYSNNSMPSSSNDNILSADVSGSTSIITGIAGMRTETGIDTGGSGGGGPEFSRAEPSPDISAGSSQVGCDGDGDEDDDDRVVLIDHHMLNYMLDDHQYYAGFVDSDSCKKL